MKWRRPAPETKLYQEYRSVEKLSADQQAQFLRVIDGDPDAVVVLPNILHRYYDIPQSEPVYVSSLIELAF